MPGNFQTSAFCSKAVIIVNQQTTEQSHYQPLVNCMESYYMKDYTRF